MSAARLTWSLATACLAALPLLAQGQVDIRTDLRSLADSLKPYMKTGFPELGIPKAEPLQIDHIAFDLKNPLVDVHVDFTDNTVAGLSNHNLEYIRADKDKKTIAMKMFIPDSVATGLYVIEGKVAVLQLDAQDPAAYRTEFKDTTVEGVAQLKVENGKLIIDGDPEITISLGGLAVKMENLFGGKAPSLAKTVDKFLNQQSDKFIKDFQPAIANSVAGFLRAFYNSAVANIDLKAFE